MSGIADAVGASLPIKINGRDVLLRPLELKDLGAVENELRTQKPNILKQAAEAAQHITDPAERKAFMDRAWREARDSITVSPEEVLRYISDTLPGFSLSMWLALEKHYPGDFTRDDVYKWLEEMAATNNDEYHELRRKRDIASRLAAESLTPSDQGK